MSNGLEERIALHNALHYRREYLKTWVSRISSDELKAEYEKELQAIGRLMVKLKVESPAPDKGKGRDLPRAVRPASLKQLGEAADKPEAIDVADEVAKGIGKQFEGDNS